MKVIFVAIDAPPSTTTLKATLTLRGFVLEGPDAFKGDTTTVVPDPNLDRLEILEATVYVPRSQAIAMHRAPVTITETCKEYLEIDADGSPHPAVCDYILGHSWMMENAMVDPDADVDVEIPVHILLP